MFDQLKRLTLSELTQVFDRMTEEDVRPLLEAIKKAKRVFLVGAGREGLSTKSFAMRLTHLGKSSYWIWDDTTPGIGTGDLLICANGRADIDIVNIVVEKAKAAGATIAMVTAAQEGYLYDFADVITRVPAEAFLAKGDFVKSKQLMGNLFEQSLFLLYDMLAMQLQQEMGVTPEEMESRHRNVE